MSEPATSASGEREPRPLIASVRLAGALCVVIGGGQVATRKVDSLLECGARVRVVSPVVTPHLRALADGGRIEWLERHYAVGNLGGARLAFAATGSSTVNAAVTAEAQATGVWVNVADDSSRGDFMVPATITRGALTIAISTGGGAPGYARRLRELLEGSIGPEYGEALELYASARPAILAADRARQATLWDELFALDLPTLIHDEGRQAAEEALAAWCLRSELA